MHYNGLMLQGSDSLFHLAAVTTTAAKLTLPGSSSRVSFPTRRSSFGSLRVRAEAAIRDGFVTEAAQLSFYELLGIPESGSLLEIKQAYKQLARKYHPDVSPPDRVEEYTRTFIRVQEAYETLSDPGLRAMYDRDMARGIHLAFSARRRYQSDEEVQKGEWKNQWESQLSELKRKSTNKNARRNMSWAARMRAQKNNES